MGCTGKTQFKKRAEGFQYSRCPGNFYNPAYAQLLDIHRMYRKGVLASPGGLMDQPSRYLELMNFLENITIQKELEQIKKQSKEAKRGR